MPTWLMSLCSMEHPPTVSLVSTTRGFKSSRATKQSSHAYKMRSQAASFVPSSGRVQLIWSSAFHFLHFISPGGMESEPEDEIESTVPIEVCCRYASPGQPAKNYPWLLSFIRDLLWEGVNVNSFASNGMSPLSIAYSIQSS